MSVLPLLLSTESILGLTQLPMADFSAVMNPFCKHLNKLQYLNWFISIKNIQNNNTIII
jgi:hypothetical protein